MANRMFRQSPLERLFDLGNNILMLFVALATLFPFWFVAVQAFNDSQDAMLGGLWFWPREFTLDNIMYVLENPHLQNAYLITVLRTVAGSLLALTVTGFAAYALSKKHLRYRLGLITFLMIPIFISGSLISNYVVYAKLQLLNTFLIFLLPTAFSFFNFIIMKTFISQLPNSIEESAKMDGAGYLTLFFRIVAPLCIPVFAAITLFNAVYHWLDVSVNIIYVTDRKLTTAQFLLYRIVRESQVDVVMSNRAAAGDISSQTNQRTVTPESLKMATLLIVTVPILFIYPFFQRFFIKGVLLGAVKE